jgi:hypothetical protein
MSLCATVRSVTGRCNNVTDGDLCGMRSSATVRSVTGHFSEVAREECSGMRLCATPGLSCVAALKLHVISAVA